MSTTYHLECDRHKESIWIGQRSHQRYYLYTAQPKTMTLLEYFLYKHVECPLSFRGSNQSEYMNASQDWVQIGEDDIDNQPV